ncbi:DUF6166 domain-containing protein [Actinomycetospora soli]|uniref:DUF6166 domain-containing protein n=1 Tax=Actinomycetospora soli TaxID=2893887 RepID=UPI001E57413B|nr:DUF6166 domain-containing protein [Actinomycetospora soli]MCD2191226.1 hypothetical protein [Actinomycetospora soli]
MRVDHPREVRFRGMRGATTSSPALVVVEDPATGETIGALEHRVRYSPTGFNWGYDGAGPRDLARSLLAAVLTDEALCNACHGAAAACDTCRDGLRPDLPSSAFTSQVVARLGPDWTLHSRQVRAWWEDHRVTLGSDRTPGDSSGTDLDFGGRA